MFVLNVRCSEFVSIFEFRISMLDVRCSIPSTRDPSLRGAKKTAEGSYKPSSVLWAIFLGHRSPDASCGLPGDDHAAGNHSPLIWPCSGWGLPCPGGYPRGRWALTPPFHPYRQPRTATGGLFSVALSVGSRRPGVTRHPALRSSDFPRTARPKAPARDPSLPPRHPEYHGAARARSRLTGPAA